MPISHLPPPFSQYANKPSSAYKNYAYQPSCNPSMMPICHNPPLASSSLSTIEPIDHRAYQPSTPSTNISIDHQAYPISHRAHWASSLLTLALLSRLLSLSACFWDTLYFWAPFTSFTTGNRKDPILLKPMDAF